MFKDMENMEFYTEVSIRDEKYRGTDFAIQYNISGRADGLIIIHDQQNQHRVVYELKTMADTSWRKLSKPLVKHISQTSIYGECLGASSVIFQYYNKNSDASKYFLTAVEPEPVQAAVAQIHRVYECLDNGTSPTREYSMWECKSCPYYYDCKPELEEQ
jgi:CRISPR/Cas system-associated exonuclease Cas4 (RecB family)